MPIPDEVFGQPTSPHPLHPEWLCISATRLNIAPDDDWRLLSRRIRDEGAPHIRPFSPIIRTTMKT